MMLLKIENNSKMKMGKNEWNNRAKRYRPLMSQYCPPLLGAKYHFWGTDLNMHIEALFRHIEVK